MSRADADYVTFGEYLIGLEGLAILRAVVDGDRAAVAQRVQELEKVVATLTGAPLSVPRQLPAVGAVEGYDEWADSYDGDGSNVTVALESAALAPLLGELPDGPVLDAGCGTGRHAARLAAVGREVHGCDVSQGMIARAAEAVPTGNFQVGSVEALPYADSSFAAVVSGLVLSHLPRLQPAMSEIARVLRPGGRALVSLPHPLATGLLGFQARFARADGTRAYIAEHAHSLGASIASFTTAGLSVRRCVEQSLTDEMARAKANHGYDDAYAAALGGLPVVVVWELERK